QHKRDELKETYEKLREMEKMKDIFISLVSHELRTPLSIIKGYVSLMDQILAATSDGTSELSRFTTSIQRAANRLEDLIKELLDCTSVKHGMGPMEKKAVPLPTVMDGLLRDFATMATGKDLVMTLVPCAGMRAIKADPGRLKEAMTHIVKNAISFTLPGGRVQ